MKIADIDAWQIFDSRGNPTIEAEVVLDNGVCGSASVPSGASRGQFEAVELRDGDPDRFAGLSVFKAIENVKDVLAPVLIGHSVVSQEEIDRAMIELDGTPKKSRLGANAILSVSMATARAAAKAGDQKLFAYLGQERGTLIPLPEIQIIGGGAHSNGRIDLQDFMIICTGAESYRECLEMTFGVYKSCGEILDSMGKRAGVADEGGYWPLFDRNEEALQCLLQSIERAGYKPGEEIGISLDIAASEFYTGDHYQLSLEGEVFSPDAYYERVTDWCRDYPVVSVEDPFAETDWQNWRRFTREFGNKIQIIGDDLFTTDVKRVREGQKQELANSVLIKLNQIGTVTETLDCIRQTKQSGWTPVVSARSGETEDPFISHLAVASNAGQLKVGSFTRSERMVKWNELIRIERELGGLAQFRNLADLRFAP